MLARLNGRLACSRSLATDVYRLEGAAPAPVQIPQVQVKAWPASN